jgi:hypothetical protein
MEIKIALNVYLALSCFQINVCFKLKILPNHKLLGALFGTFKIKIAYNAILNGQKIHLDYAFL